MASNAEEIKSNLDALRGIHSKAIDVLNASKKKTNKEISTETGLHITLISRILNRAKEYEFVEKKNNKWAKTKKIKGYNLKNMVPNNKKDYSTQKDVKKRKKPIKKNYDSMFVTEANKNISAYVDIYSVENLLRQIIFEVFGKSKGWWKEEKLPRGVFEYADKIREAESKHSWIKKRGDHPLYYVGLSELKKILSKHYDNSFKWIENRERFMRLIEDIIPIRNMIAHNVPLEKEEINFVETNSKWIINLIKNQKEKNKTKN